MTIQEILDLTQIALLIPEVVRFPCYHNQFIHVQFSMAVRESEVCRSYCKYQ